MMYDVDNAADEVSVDVLYGGVGDGVGIDGAVDDGVVVGGVGDGVVDIGVAAAVYVGGGIAAGVFGDVDADGFGCLGVDVVFAVLC